MSFEMRRKVNVRMMIHRRLFFLIPLLLVPGCATAQVGEPPMKVLFIGNSYTSVNDLPSLVEALAEAAGGQKIESDQYLPGGYTFEQHAKDEKALEKIREKKWDVVVLQEQSLFPVLNRESMHKYARILHEEISKQGAKTVFYLTWARQDIPQMQDGADPATSPDYARAMFQTDRANQGHGLRGIVQATQSWAGRWTERSILRYCQRIERYGCPGGRGLEEGSRCQSQPRSSSA